MNKQLDVQDDEPEGCLTSAIKRLAIAAALILLLLPPCNLATRSTTFTIDGTPYPAKCLNAGHRTLACEIYTK